MTYADFDKRKLLLPDLLGKPLAITDGDGNMIALKDFSFSPDHYIFVYPVDKWQEILEIRGEL